MLTRKLGSRVVLYSVAVLAIGALLAAKWVLDVQQGERCWQISGVHSRKRILITGELRSFLRPLDLGSRTGRRLWLEVIKSRRVMRLKAGRSTLKSYLIALGPNADLRRSSHGDCATPEGDYHICGKSANSHYYLQMTLSYPSIEDARRGLKAGIIDRRTSNQIVSAIRRGGSPPMETPLGGYICIHGGGIGAITRDADPPYVDICDWTQGCIAIGKQEISELYDLLPVGARVRIRP